MKLDIEADVERIKMRCIKKMTAGDEALVAIEALKRLKRIGILARSLADCVLSDDQLELAEILRLCGVNHD